MHHACDVLVAPPAVRAAYCGLLKNCNVADPMALLNMDPAAIGQRGTKWDAPPVYRTVAPVPSFVRVADGLVGDEMIDAVCDWVFGEAELLHQQRGSRNVRGRGYAAGRRVLTPTNRAAWNITERVCKRMGAPDNVSLSVDESNGEGRGYVPPGELNTIESASLPPHRLEIRIGHPYMLLRNFRGKHMNAGNEFCRTSRQRNSKLVSYLF